MGRRSFSVEGPGHPPTGKFRKSRYVLMPFLHFGTLFEKNYKPSLISKCGPSCGRIFSLGFSLPLFFSDNFPCLILFCYPSSPNYFSNGPSVTPIIAELRRAKRASGAPWVRNFGNLSMREILVMTSAYARPPARPYRRSGRGSGVLRQPDQGWGEENRLWEMGSR